MAVTSPSDVYYDPYDVAIDADPYPTFRRLREEAPLYYNEPHDFYAVSRFEDVERGLKDPATFISGRGGILELIKAGIEMPPGILIFEDPPDPHDPPPAAVPHVHAQAGGRPRAEDPGVLRRQPRPARRRPADSTSSPTSAPRCRCARSACCSASPRTTRRPSATTSTGASRTKAGEPMKVSGGVRHAARCSRSTSTGGPSNPSDDIMTELLHAEFEDETGTVRRLTQAEVLTYINVVAGAGNETTTRLIGWAGKVLADHPDQRRELVDGPLADPQRHRGAPPLRAAGPPRRPLRGPRRRVPRPDRAGRAAPCCS